MRPGPEQDIAAAKALAARLGLGAVEPEVIKLAHHTTVRLGGIVARVQSGDPVPGAQARMASEVALGRALADVGGPVVAPIRDPSPGPYTEGAAVITLWDFVEHRAADEAADALAAGRSLKALHAALATVGGGLPPFTAGLAACAERVADRRAMRALAEPDRRFLERRLEVLRAGLAADSAEWRPLHGDTHLGNLMITPDGPLWCDLETCCRGPIEWDLGPLPPTARDVFAPFDEERLARISELRSVSVAVWCWADVARTPQVREGAEYHLARAKALAGA